MTKTSPCSQAECNYRPSSSGFIFGLICGAVIGAVIAVIIYKNNKTEVFANFQNKIKNFFDNLLGRQPSPPSKSPVKRYLATTPPTPTPKKPKTPPKTFIKPKK